MREFFFFVLCFYLHLISPAQQTGIGDWAMHLNYTHINTVINADIYIFGEQGKDYADVNAFESKDVHPYFQYYNHPIYKQIQGEFDPFMSVIDLIFNQGKASKEIIMTDNVNRLDIIK